MKNWSDSLQHTDIGVMLDCSRVASELQGKARVEAMTPEVKRVINEMKRLIKKGPDFQVFKNNKDGSLLIIGRATPMTSSPEHFALFSKQGRLIERFVIDAW
jgi:hypothetical protein